MEIFRFSVGDKLRLKKKHPCGNDVFSVLRGGTDVRIVCDLCSRDLTVDRASLDRMIKAVIVGKAE